MAPQLRAGLHSARIEHDLPTLSELGVGDVVSALANGLSDANLATADRVHHAHDVGKVALRGS